MAWFTPAELPDNKYFIFGKGGCEKLAKEKNTSIIAQIPLVQSVCENGDAGLPSALDFDSVSGKAFSDLADNFVKVVEKRNAEQPPTKQVVMK
jgi:ATP-binding protein involved in chromosome partitioning